MNAEMLRYRISLWLKTLYFLKRMTSTTTRKLQQGQIIKTCQWLVITYIISLQSWWLWTLNKTVDHIISSKVKKQKPQGHIVKRPLNKLINTTHTYAYMHGMHDRTCKSTNSTNVHVNANAYAHIRTVKHIQLECIHKPTQIYIC